MLVQQVNTPDGISWHTETFKSHDESAKEYIVLVPSGEGDCQNMGRVAQLLSTNGPYHVLTFDMPGMSRSVAPVDAVKDVRAEMLATQVVGLLDKLQIPRASFFGCSSGGLTILTIGAMYPSHMKCGIVHEVPLEFHKDIGPLVALSDEDVKPVCAKIFMAMNATADGEGERKWEALGPEYHARLSKNYVTWIRSYGAYLVDDISALVEDPENLKRRPLFWTVGALNPGLTEDGGTWKKNFKVAQSAGIEADSKRLQCLHFPSVTVPEETAIWIAECVTRSS